MKKILLSLIVFIFLNININAQQPTTNYIPIDIGKGNCPGPNIFFTLYQFNGDEMFGRQIGQQWTDFIIRASFGQAIPIFTYDRTTSPDQYGSSIFNWVTTNKLTAYTSYGTIAINTVLHEIGHMLGPGDCEASPDDGKTIIYAGDLNCPNCYGGWCGDYTIYPLPYAEGIGWISETNPRFKLLTITNNQIFNLVTYESFTEGNKGFKIPYEIINNWRLTRQQIGSEITTNYSLSSQIVKMLFFEHRPNLNFYKTSVKKGKKNTGGTYNNEPGLQARVWEKYGDYWKKSNGFLHIKPYLSTSIGYNGNIKSGLTQLKQTIIDNYGTVSSNVDTKIININIYNLTVNGGTVDVKIQ